MPHSAPTYYAFEEATPELPRPTLAAQRALGAIGVRIQMAGWLSLSVEQRQGIATEGARGIVDLSAVTALSGAAPVRQMVLINREREPDPDDVPSDLAKALGPGRRLSAADWRAIRGLDRYVLARLQHNQRLLARAWKEIFSERVAAGLASPCTVGHCELRTTSAALAQLANPKLLDGAAFLIARRAGVRAARRAGEIIDLHAEREAAAIELDWAIKSDHQLVLWQSHVSEWDGTFFPAASLLAATTAAVTLQDILRMIDPRAIIGAAGVYETSWQVGGHGDLRDDPMSSRPGARVRVLK